MTKRTGLVAVLTAAAVVSGAPPAMAQAPPSPAGCSASELDIDPDQSPSIVRQGDVIDYVIRIENVGPNACDVRNVNVTLQTPSRSGAPSSVLQPVAAFQNFASQYPQQPLGVPYLVLGPVRYTVDVDPGVTVINTRARVDNAELQNLGRTAVNINKGTSGFVFAPSITIDKVGSITGPAPAPQAVTYTFYVRNGSNPSLPEDATTLSNVSVTDDKCGKPTYVRGDANGNSKLEVSETWEFQCTLTHPAPGTYTNVAVANGENILNNRSVPVVSPPDNWTVVLTPPAPGTPGAPTPQTGVLPVNTTQAPCVIASPTGLNVRARELTTIRVRVRNVDAGTEARITLPGGKVLRAKTNSSGTATFRVRPTRSGRAAIRVAECSDVERFSVRPARQVQTRRVPRVTG